MTYQPPVTGGPYGQDPYGQQQPPYGQQPYGPGGPYPYGPPRRTNTMAIMALVFGFVFAPLGIYFGYRAKQEIAVSGEDGEGMATAGIIVGWVHCGLWALSILLIIVYFVIIIVFIGLAAGTAGVAGSTNSLLFLL